MTNPRGHIRISAVLSVTGKLLGQHMGKMLFLAVLYFLPLILLLATGWVDPAALTNSDADGYWIYAVALQTLLMLVVATPMTYICLQALRGTDVGVLKAIVDSVRYIPPVLVVSIVAAVLTGIGIALLIIPGLIVMTYLAVVVPAAIAEEDVSPNVAFNQSVALVKGNVWPTFAVVLMIFVPSALVGYLPSHLTTMMHAALILLANIVIMAVSVPLTAALYVALRETRQGMEQTDIEALFD